ncbi:MAG: translation initiation factor [Wolinella sp.]
MRTQKIRLEAKMSESWSVERVCKKCGELESECVCTQESPRKSPLEHHLSVFVQKRQGRMVTCVGEFFIDEKLAWQYLQQLKNALGCGGTYKGGFVEIQGERKERVASFFKEAGFGFKR